MDFRETCPIIDLEGDFVKTYELHERIRPKNVSLERCESIKTVWSIVPLIVNYFCVNCI
jgi:hypothetical protein